MKSPKHLVGIAGFLRQPLKRRTSVAAAALVGAVTGGIGLAIYFRSLREFIPVELAGALVLATSFVSGVDAAHVARIVMPILGGSYGFFRARGSNRQLAALAHETPPSRFARQTLLSDLLKAAPMTIHRQSPAQQVQPPAGHPAAEPDHTMQALVQDRYGSPDVLRITEVPRPSPGRGEVLVRVEAASVNARDWHVMRGEPRVARLMDRTIFGRRGPRVRIRGTDFAGVVETVGPDVTEWEVGDRVLGEADAAIAQYVLTPVGGVAQIPAGMSAAHAAALPLAANTALTCLRAADPRPDTSVLINGASGGVGTFAVQLARSMGLHVTAVCSARNADLARTLGAEAVLDYAREDFASGAIRYDLVVDLVGNRTLRDLRRAVKPSGSLVLSGGGVSGEGRIVGPVGMLLRAQVLKIAARPRIHIPQATPSRAAFQELVDLVAAGAITPIVDRTFAFTEAADAIRYLEAVHARAKVVVDFEV